jgi:hypothetical protein
MTPKQPYDLPVVVVATNRGAVVRVVKGVVDDPDRMPGYQTAVSLKKLRPRATVADLGKSDA